MNGTSIARRLGPAFWIPMGWILFVVLVALLSPWLPFKDPGHNFIVRGERPPYPPSAEHWLGTDQDARDLLARIVAGARVSLTVGFASIAFGMVVGGALGMVAGYVRGWFDKVTSFLFLTLLSFPGLVMAILITALISRSTTTIAITIGLGSIAPVGRLARAATLAFAEREFVTAAQAIGTPPRRILWRELLPNVVVPMSALALLGVAVAIVAEGGLAFLGLSVEKGVTWGKLILTGAQTRTLRDAPWVAFFPIGAMFLTVMALNQAGDRLREVFDVRGSGLDGG